jgi:predicted outer membrane repeat protein
MFAHSAHRWFPRALSRLARRPAAPPFRPRVEWLEDRTAPATFEVQNTSDNTGEPSLRQIILDLNNSTDATNTITFLKGMTGKITLSFDLPPIQKPVTIQGPGAAIEINGNGFASVFTFDDADPNSITATVRDLTIRNAFRLGNGGAVFNQNERVTFQRVLFENNQTASNGGAIASFGGSVTLDDCLFQDNTASINGGGLFIGLGSANITRTRFLRNTAFGDSGAVHFFDGSLLVSESSFGQNSASGLGGSCSSGPRPPSRIPA